MLLATVSATAQIGIGTMSPQGALDVVSPDNGIILPRVANTAAVTTPINGMLVYDVSSKCFKGYANDAWTNCLSATSNPIVSSLDCAGAVASPSVINEGIAYSGTITLPYSGGNGDVYSSGTPVNSTGVTGLTATLQSGRLEVGDGNLTFSLTGTPATSGTASFAITFKETSTNLV